MEPKALELYNRAGELGDELDYVAQYECQSSEQIVIEGKKGNIYTFKDGSKLTTSETGYIGREHA